MDSGAPVRTMLYALHCCPFCLPERRSSERVPGGPQQSRCLGDKLALCVHCVRVWRQMLEPWRGHSAMDACRLSGEVLKQGPSLAQAVFHHLISLMHVPVWISAVVIL